MKTFYWLVKREYWEHRGGFLWAPLVTAAVFVVLQLMSTITSEVFLSHHSDFFVSNPSMLDFRNGRLDTEALDKVGLALDTTLRVIASIMLGVMAIVVFFYCLGSLYDDRRDRSWLFWKSLPPSDLATVLSKVFSATVVAPIIACAFGVLAGLLLLLIGAAQASLHGIHVWQLLMNAHPIRVMLSLIAVVPIYVVWALPTVGWLMLCSAWARSKPFLWALALPVISGVMISWFGIMGLFNLRAGWFWVNVVLRMLGSVVPGSWLFNADAVHGVPHHWATEQGSFIAQWLTENYATLASPGIWIGALFGLGMIAIAVWLRRWRDDA